MSSSSMIRALAADASRSSVSDSSNRSRRGTKPLAAVLVAGIVGS